MSKSKVILRGRIPRKSDLRGVSANAYLTVTISGSPKSGKSTLAIDLASHLERKFDAKVRLLDSDESELTLLRRLERSVDILREKYITIRTENR